MSLSEKLLARILIDGAIPRGAFSRIAEAVDVRPSTVRKWLLFGAEPSVHVAPGVERYLARRRIQIRAVRPGRKSANGKKCVA